MQHLGWFFAGISVGLFFGVFLAALARVAGWANEEQFVRVEEPSGTRKLALVRR